MTSSTAITSLPDAAGTSFKPVHADAVMAGGHPVAWFEIHAENYMIDGGPMRWQLEALAASYPVSCHGVGLSIGSMQPLDRDHLGRLRTLLDWLEPAAFSEHLAWSSHGGTCFNDLLPLPYTRQTLARVVEHINQVQDVLGRRMLLENPSLYIDFDCHEMSETEFISEIIRQTGCGILLDINNVVVSSTNQGLEAEPYLDALPMEAVGEIHLAGHAVDQDGTGARLLIDSHDTCVSGRVWDLYSRVIEIHGARPTLIEWDGNLPPFATLAAEAEKAAAILGLVTDMETGHAVAG
ncbi:DUF692 domain-containing protein [Alphaproteobacteria bacterium LSUCC0684]